MKPQGEGAIGRSKTHPEEHTKETRRHIYIKVAARPDFSLKLKKQKLGNQVPKSQFPFPTNEGSTTLKRRLCPPRRSQFLHGVTQKPGQRRRTRGLGAIAGKLTSSCSKWAGIWVLWCRNHFPRAESVERSSGQLEQRGDFGSGARLCAAMSRAALGNPSRAVRTGWVSRTDQLCVDLQAGYLKARAGSG